MRKMEKKLQEAQNKNQHPISSDENNSATFRPIESTPQRDEILIQRTKNFSEIELNNVRSLLQERINECNSDNLEHLKTLQKTLIRAEFSQIFSTLSNYNEIDQFYKRLQERFYINELKEEYLSSVNLLTTLTQIEIDKVKGDTLNTILLALTIYQVWFGICGVGIYPLNNSWIIVTGFIIITALFMAKTEVRNFLFTSINPIKKK